jgi:hypothetical protein
VIGSVCKRLSVCPQSTRNVTELTGRAGMEPHSL